MSKINFINVNIKQQLKNYFKRTQIKIYRQSSRRQDIQESDTHS
jgi:hypothetical protein